MKRYFGLTAAWLTLVSSIAFGYAYTGTKNSWFYPGGYFLNMDGVGWTETQNGHTAFSFRQLAKTSEYVEIYDDSRHMHVRIHDSFFELRLDSAVNFTFFKNGGWDDRRILRLNPDDSVNYFEMGTGGIWKWHWWGSNDPKLYKEIGRGGDFILLYDAQNDVHITILDGSLDGILVQYRKGPEVSGQSDSVISRLAAWL